MASRKSIYLSTAAENVIGPVESLSGRINAIVIRYGGIVERDCPSFTEGEWLAICDALNGTWLLVEQADTDPARYLWAEIADCDRLSGLGAKWGIDALAVAEIIKVAPYAQQVAIAEIVARFWQDPQLNDLPNRDLLAKCGAKIAE